MAKIRQEVHRDTMNYDHVVLSPTEQIGLHHQNSWEMSYIIRGTGKRIIGDTYEDFNEGEVVLIVPEMPHQWIFNKDNTDNNGNIENITITFPVDFLQQLASIFPEYTQMAKWFDDLQASIKFPKSDADSISILLRQMEFEQPHERINSLIGLLSDIYRNKRFALAGNFSSNDSMADRVKKINTWLACNYQHEVSIDSLAKYIGMNRSSLCTFYKHHTGETIFGHLMAIRVGIAKHILETEDVSIAQCCYKSGFNDIPHFNRTFKRFTGKTPNEYRKTNQL